MKILHIIPNLYSGGAERFCIDICNELCKDHEVYLCTLYDISPDMFLSKQMEGRITHISFNKKKGIDFKLIFRLYKLIRDFDPQVVNTHLSSIQYIVLSAFLLRKPRYFHTIHNLAEKETHGPLSKLLRKILFKFKKVIPVSISKTVYNSVIQYYGQINSPIIINGVIPKTTTQRLKEVQVEINKLKYDESTKVFLTIGRIIEQKNLHMLFSVFGELKRSGENIILLHIGGDPTPESGLRKRLEEQKPENVFFLGVRENIQDYLEHVDFFCLSSIYEGLPITILEAMNAGTICLATPVGGIPEVLIDGYTGFISKSTGHDDFKKALKEMINLKDSELKAIRKAAKINFFENYSMSLTSAKYLKSYIS